MRRCGQTTAPGWCPRPWAWAPVAPADLAVVDFNDLGAVERVLSLGRTAAVLTEGVLTNRGTVLPDAGFLPGLRDACTRHGTLLVIDETHTQFDCLRRHRHPLRRDARHGHRRQGHRRRHSHRRLRHDQRPGRSGRSRISAMRPGHEPGIALGGTLFANALSLACAEVVLTELMTPAEHDRIAGPGRATGRRHRGRSARNADSTGARTGSARARGYCLRPELPRTAREADASLDPLFADTRRVYLRQPGRVGRHLERPGRTPASPMKPPTSTSTWGSSTTSSARCARANRAPAAHRGGLGAAEGLPEQSSMPGAPRSDARAMLADGAGRRELGPLARPSVLGP